MERERISTDISYRSFTVSLAHRTMRTLLKPRGHTGWCHSYLLSSFWKRLSLWSLSTPLSYYLLPVSCRVSKEESIASRTRNVPRHCYSRMMRFPRPTQPLPLCYPAEVPSQRWSERSRGMSVPGLVCLRFFTSSLQGAWSPVVPPNIDSTRLYYPPSPNHRRTRCTSIPGRS